MTDPRDTDRPERDDAPDAPTDLSKRSWWQVLRRTVREFNQDGLTD